MLTRRGFLEFASVAAIAAACGGWAHGVSYAFNGGKSQGQSTFLESAGDYPFINCLKTAQRWGFVSAGGAPAPNTLDSNGYPTSISNGGVTTVFFIPSQTNKPGNYVIDWTGNGTVSTSASINVSGGASLAVTTISGGPSSSPWVISIADSAPNNTRVVLSITATTVTNLRYYNINDQAAQNQGQIFSPKYKSVLAAGRFGAWRFLDWTRANTSNVSQWAYRKPTTYVFYDGDEFRSSLYAGTTTNVGDAYSITFGSGAPIDKQTIHLTWNASATTTAPTLNLNSSGAVTIVAPTGATLDSGTQKPVATSIATLVYDADLNLWLKFGGDGDLFSTGLINGVPPEICVQLCIELGMHAWFPLYYLCADPISDYASSLASYIKGNSSAKWMVPRFEGPNEQWNSQFYVENYSLLKGQAHWSPRVGSVMNWYGKVMSTLGQSISAVFGADRTKYQVVCGVQTTTASSSSNSDARLTAASFVIVNGGDPAYTWVTHVCVANYFGSFEINTAAEVADAYSYSVGNPTQQAAIIASYVAQCSGDLTQVNGYYTGWQTWIAGFNSGHSLSIKYNAYEGGYSPDLISTGAITSAISAATNAASAVLTAATTTFPGGSPQSGNGAVIGQSVLITGASGGTWATINGNTYTVQAVSGNSVTINLDSSGLGTLSSATMTYVGAGGGAGYVNALRLATKSSSLLNGFTTTNYGNFVSAGGEFPSMYDLCAPSSAFSVYDPDIYATPSPQWTAIVVFNH